MKKPQFKSVATVLAISLLLASAFTLIIQAQTPTSTFWVTPGAYPGAPDYTVWREGSEYFAKSEMGSLATAGGTNLTSLLESILVDNTHLFFMEGEYVLAEEFLLDGLDNASISGAGIGVTEITGSSDGAFVKGSGAESVNVQFRDLTLNGGGHNTITLNLGNGTIQYSLYNVEITNSGNFLMYGDAAYWLTVDHCRFSSSGLSVAADLCAVASYDSKWTNNYFEKTDGNGGACLSAGHMVRTTISNNHFRNNATFSYASISLENHYNFFLDIVVSDNMATGWNSSAIFNIGNSQNYEFTNPTVTGNIITGGGIGLDRVMGGICSNNHIRNSFYGLHVINVTNMVFDGNVIKNTAVNGVGSPADKGGFYGSWVYNSTISNNIITDTQTPHTTYYGIVLAGNFSLIEGNRVTNTLNYGIKLEGGGYPCFNNTLAGNQLHENAGWGIVIDPGASNNMVYGNYMWGNGLGNISDSGTNTIYLGGAGAAGPAGPAGPAGTTEAKQPYDYLVFRNATATYMINGVTGAIDDSGTPSNVINNAIGNASGGLVLLSQNSFQLSADTGIDLDVSNTVLQGCGRNTILHCNSDFDDHIISITASGCKVKNLKINCDYVGGNQDVAYDGINVMATTTWLEDLDIESCGRDGVRVGDPAGGGWYAGKISHVRISGNGEYGLYMTYDATDWEIHSFLINSHGGTDDAGIRLEGTNNRFTNGHLWGNYYELIVAEARSVRGALFSNVIFADGGQGIEDGTHRVYHTSANSFRDSTFVGCEFWSCYLAGSPGTYSGMYLDGTTYGLSITGNIFRGADQDDTPKEGLYGIFLDASSHNITIVANVFHFFSAADPIQTTGAGDIDEGHNIILDCG